MSKIFPECIWEVYGSTYEYDRAIQSAVVKAVATHILMLPAAEGICKLIVIAFVLVCQFSFNPSCIVITTFLFVPFMGFDIPRNFA